MPPAEAGAGLGGRLERGEEREIIVKVDCDHS